MIALADGAGGTSGGDLAAQAIVEAAVAAATAPRPTWDTLLDELDRDRRRLGHGQATAILLTLTEDGLHGASVGDSEGWLVDGDKLLALTAGQPRKPLVGAGAIPVAFGHGGLGSATLVVGSDGLWKYAARRAIARIAAQDELPAAAQQLVDLVRLANGDLQDDVSVILCRRAATSD